MVLVLKLTGLSGLLTRINDFELIGVIRVNVIKLITTIRITVIKVIRAIRVDVIRLIRVISEGPLNNNSNKI